MIVNQRGIVIVAMLAAVLPWAAGGCGNPPSITPTNANEACSDAMDVLHQAAEDTDPVTRCHAIEALAGTLGAREHAVYIQALGDPNALVRYAAAVAIGDVKYAGAKEALLKLAATDNNKLPFCGYIYALYRLGDSTYAGELGKLLFDREPEVRALAAQCMGFMGEPSAIGPLNTLRSDEQSPLVVTQLVESLAILGDSRAQLFLESYARLSRDERLVAIDALARINSPRALPVVRSMFTTRQQAPEVRVNAAGAMAQMGDVSSSAYNICVEAIRKPEPMLKAAYGEALSQDQPEKLRALAALSLGYMHDPAGVDVLAPLLKDSSARVRVAAAKSILRLLPAYWPAEGSSVKALTPAASSQPTTDAPAGSKLYSSGAKE